ncbi:MAG: hypothetical protein Q4E07_01805 [Eubacteriales bacterium]|nr:hypothetical protein [Eubacteriales bacterium]
MGFFDALKVRQALMKHQKGNKQEAEKAYEELYNSGIIQAAYILPYSTLLLRTGEENKIQKAKEMLLKAQKASDYTPERRQQLLVNYSIASFLLGDKEKAIQTLEAADKKYPCGLIYQTLGYLYVESGDKEKALAYNQKALEYDDEDSVVLDNIGQMYYRLYDDKEKAEPYFRKANELKPNQIDTLYFLSRYDLEKGDKNAAIEKLEYALEGTFSPLNYKKQEEIKKEIAALKNP